MSVPAPGIRPRRPTLDPLLPARPLPADPNDAAPARRDRGALERMRRAGRATTTSPSGAPPALDRHRIRPADPAGELPERRPRSDRRRDQRPNRLAGPEGDGRPRIPRAGRGATRAVTTWLEADRSSYRAKFAAERTSKTNDDPFRVVRRATPAQPNLTLRQRRPRPQSRASASARSRSPTPARRRRPGPTRLHRWRLAGHHLDLAADRSRR